ncbi:MAG: chorismate synthase [Bacteroidales bacterium]|nr:chorismate synthase [Bacteroidales bacterium]MCF8404147.1 chorismate synthase [Bacteroidales bacterium]
MAGNSFGHIFKLTSFGESHGPAIGGIIDGCPSGLVIDFEFIRREMEKRRPVSSQHSSSRLEADTVEFLSGIFEGKSTGAPIGFIINNTDVKSEDYLHLKETYRPSHADFTYEAKYGFRDYRGGGRASARETAVRVVGGAIAKLLIGQKGMQVSAYVSQIGNVKLTTPYGELDLENTIHSEVKCPDKKISAQMESLIKETKLEGDTLGGEIFCVVKNVPSGLGEPVFDKVEAELAKAIMSINAVKGFEIGSGFKSICMKGSEHNDLFEIKNGKVVTLSNFSGGVLGGISNGQDIYFKTAFKPVATIMKEQASVNKFGENVILQGKGRHDVCVVPRAVPIVEAMTAMVLADLYLRSLSSKIT